MVEYYTSGRIGNTYNFILPFETAEIRIIAIGGGGAGVAGGFDNGDNGCAGRPGSYVDQTIIISDVTLTITLGNGAAGAASSYGAAGGATSVVVPTYGTISANGGITSTTDAPNSGWGAWYLTQAGVQTTDSSYTNSYYTTLSGGTRTGGYSLGALDAYNAYTVGSNGIKGGAGGGGGGYRDNVDGDTVPYGSRKGGDGGAGYVRIYY